MNAIAPILPVAGVPDELLKAINDRLRLIAGGSGSAGRGLPGPAGPAGTSGDANDIQNDDGSPVTF